MSNPYKIHFIPVLETLKERRGYVYSLNYLERSPQYESTFKDSVKSMSLKHFELTERARLFINDNWGKVKDWSKYVLRINGIEYTNDRAEFNCEPYDIWDKLTKSINKNRVNIDSIKIDYDFTDSDIFVEINGDSKILNDTEVLNLAIYIEENMI